MSFATWSSVRSSRLMCSLCGRLRLFGKPLPVVQRKPGLFSTSSQHFMAKSARKKDVTQETVAKPTTTTPLIVELLMSKNQADPVDDKSAKYLEDYNKKLDDLAESLGASKESTTASLESTDDDFDEEVERDDLLSENIDGKMYVEDLDFDLPLSNLSTDPEMKKKKESGHTNVVSMVSKTPCPGCGANLHCQDSEKPGYIPSEKFLKIPPKELREHYCHRCHLMRDYNIALNASVTPDEYEKIIAKIKDVQALTVLIVDMLDIPNSLFKGLPKLIGRKRPIFILGNKVDLIPKDANGYLRHLEQALEQACRDEGYYNDLYVHYVGLISAKTGFGVEELINRLFGFWSTRGHVYILGCTNAGKSSLFNTLIQSDYCKAGAQDYTKRATISVWPGTTLNLLQFPIMTAVPSKVYFRWKRLKAEKQESIQEAKLAKYSDEARKVETTTTKGQVRKTFLSLKEEKLEEHHSHIHGYDGATYSFNPKAGTVEESQRTRKALREEVLGPKEPYEEDLYSESRWCYDTPGVVNPEQVINLLTQEELNLLPGKKPLKPRIFVIHPSQVMFVSGLARIDYLEGPRSTYVTAITSSLLPIHIVNNTEADQFYRDNYGTETLGIPLGDEERLGKLPAMEGVDIDIVGSGWKISDSDITLSSIGWVAVTGGSGMEMKFRAYTPGGAGCGLRYPGLLPFIVQRRGIRIKGTPSYMLKKSAQK